MVELCGPKFKLSDQEELLAIREIGKWDVWSVLVNGEFPVTKDIHAKR